ncbi:MAG: glutamine-hydrolyzing carbamoyl-phosphate synthase small subunit [Promethearchaeota archaeon]
MLNIEEFQRKRKAVLVLKNEKIFWGTGFGASKKVIGEVVFTTFTAAGYYCALTDPSNQGQIYILTYPLIGNYGIPAQERDEFGLLKHFESDSIKCAGFVVHEACKNPSHYESVETIHDFLLKQDIPGIEGIDTRELTRLLRSEGVQVGFLQVFNENEKIPNNEELLQELDRIEDPNIRNFVQEVSCREIRKFTPQKSHGKVVLVDCGVKNNIIRELLKRNLEVILVPFDSSYDVIMSFAPDGVLISNGPGDPKQCKETIVAAKNLIENDIPTMGICLGNQILGLAAGGDTFKLKYGHRGGNKTVLDLRNRRAFVTSQNHGYAVDESSLKSSGFLPMFRNADDQTNEGIYHPDKPIFAVQFHPEACPGPEDTTYLFDEFIRNIAFNAFGKNGEGEIR